ncbi:unnamed protein product [Albugo candida]|uniref:Protein kinase domain-containing protein n=1 Tax=Albugo candida TaxID=65357 RepID=A0A024GHG1_9STRA|nr:unnamed protein product [Albugo candida]|eukprot:CCI45787.1 unnamed protein product [Albugo candida]
MLRQTAGTPYFHAPEMLTGESFLGKPTDVWACGITLYMFIYGRSPYQADRISELYDKILNEAIEYPVSVSGEAVDNRLIDMMQKILAKDPTKRYTTQQIRTHESIENSFSILD